ncbi:MAG: molybdopterin molybdotransferase MoeA [Pseudomonadota bacterium]
MSAANLPAPLPLEEAQARLLALTAPLPIERVDVPGAIGRYLAAPLMARRMHPAAHVSAMDGYAVRADDLAGPWHVVGESAAGHPFAGALGAGDAVRISTGALVPEGVNAVIIQEDVRRDGANLVLTGKAPMPAGRHIRPAGHDFLCDAELMPIGHRIGPAQIALAIGAGHRHLTVRRPPRVAIIDSGDELAPDPETCALHQIPASNGAMLAALVASLPAEIVRIGPVPDNVTALTGALDQAREADVIVTTGGASVGDRDFIRPALADWGATLDFWRVAMKPGKPLLVARKGTQLIVGLPGNPVSGMVTAYFFLLPLLRALLGAAAPFPRALPLRLTAALPAVGMRREFVRGRFADDGIAAVRSQDSGALTALAATDVLIDRRAHAPPASVGEDVCAYLLQNGGIA